MRPLASGVAVMWARATDMLAVAVQLPAEPEATVGAASATNAQIADATDLTLTTQGG
jgi:hypothetical protein